MSNEHIARLLPNSLRVALLVLSFFGTHYCSAQYYNIHPEIRQSAGANNYHYAISGVAQFPENTILHADLLTPGDTSEVLFSGLVNFTEPGNSTLPLFSYDTQTETFSFEPGDFSTGDLYLHMWFELNGVIYNELYYHQ